MPTYENRGIETSPTTDGASTTDSPDAEQQARENIEQIVGLLEDTDWRCVPPISTPEAAALTERLTDAGEELEEAADGD